MSCIYAYLPIRYLATSTITTIIEKEELNFLAEITHIDKLVLVQKDLE